jgi:hypothetical protein
MKLFDEILRRSKLQGIPGGVRMPEHREPSPDEIRAEALHLWAQDPKCVRHFDGLLAEMIEGARQNMHEKRQNHPEITYWLGFEAALVGLHAHFTAWRENRTPAPQEKGTP